jgi:integrase
MRIVKEKKADGSTRYLARPIIGGKKLAVRATTKRQLESKVAKLKEQADRRRRGLPVDPEPRAEMTYGALCDLLLDGYPHREQSKRALRYNLRYSRDRFGRIPVQAIRLEDARAWFARLPVAPTTKRNALAAARQAITFAVQTGYAESNAFKQIEKPRPSENKHPFESWDDVHAVAGALRRSVEQALVVFTCATGLRPQEWRALEWRDVDLAAGVLRVNRAVQGGKIIEAEAKTPGALRAVELVDLALEALGALPTPLRREQLVFPGARGGILDVHAWSRQGARPGPWTLALDAADLSYREPPQMRHTFATLALVDGASIEWIAKQMGHEDVSTTLRHYHKWLPSDRRNVNALNEAHAARTGLKPDAAVQEAK